MRKNTHWRNYKRCRGCFRTKRTDHFDADPANQGGFARRCKDCAAGMPIDEVRVALAKDEMMADVATPDQAYCASLYESARAKVRRGLIRDTDPEFRDALKSMEFLTRTEGMFRTGGYVYHWDRGGDRLERREETRLIADARDWQVESTEMRVFREPRFQPQRGVPMRPVYA